MAVVPAANEQFALKLSKLLDGVPNKSAIARAIGIVPQVLDQYVKGSTPKPALVYRLCEVLNVSPNWLLNDDADIENPVPFDKHDPPISEASYFDFIREAADRSVEYTIALRSLLDLADEVGDGFDIVAFRVLMPHDPVELPSGVEKTIEIANRLDDYYHRVKRLRSVFNDNYSVDMQLNKLRQPKDAVLPDALIERSEKLDRNHPGIPALREYRVVREADPGEDRTVKLNCFWQERAAYHIARLIDLPVADKHPKKAEMRATLRKMGYITADETPAPFPSFQTWYPLNDTDPRYHQPLPGHEGDAYFNTAFDHLGEQDEVESPEKQTAAEEDAESIIDGTPAADPDRLKKKKTKRKKRKQ